MKSIVLHTARVDNGGNRRAAGEEVPVGDKPDQITLATATDLVARHLGSGRGYAKKPTAKRPRQRKTKPAPQSEPSGPVTAPTAARAEDPVTGERPAPNL